MGAYYQVSADGCQVITSDIPLTGSSTWHPSATPGRIYGVAQWNAMWGGAYKVPCMAHCPGCTPPPPAFPWLPPAQQPPAQQPPSGLPTGATPIIPSEGPITGPPPVKPPAEGCGHAMSMRTDGARLRFETDEHLRMPQGSAFSGLDIARADGTPWLTTEAMIARDGDSIRAYHPAHGPTYTVFHPAELDPRRHLWGDGARATGGWPRAIANGTLLLLTADGNNGQQVRQRLAWGLPIDTSSAEPQAKPRSGIYAEWNPSTRKLNWQVTDANGADDSAGGMQINGVDIGTGGGVTFPIQAPDDGVANYAFNAGTTPGSENAGMGFTPSGEGPSLFDIAGDAQLVVGTTGVTIPNKLTVDGLIDPTGLELDPVAANPGGVAANTLWLDANDSDALKWGSSKLATQNFVSSGYQPLDADLTSLAALTGTGFAVRTGIFGTWAPRALAAGSSRITITNEDGVSGNPTIDANQAAFNLDSIGGTLSVSKGGTGATSASGARTNLDVPPNSRAINNGYGITGGGNLSADRTLAVSLSNASAFLTTAQSITSASYADLTGCSVSLAAGTWLIVATMSASAANLAFLAHLAITDASNNIVREASQGVPASGTASVHQWANLAVHAIVSPASTTTYKLRAARGNTTLTNSYTAQDGSGQGVTNNASTNTDKATGIIAIRIA